MNKWYFGVNRLSLVDFFFQYFDRSETIRDQAKIYLATIWKLFWSLPFNFEFIYACKPSPSTCFGGSKELWTHQTKTKSRDVIDNIVLSVCSIIHPSSHDCELDYSWFGDEKRCEKAVPWYSWGVKKLERRENWTPLNKNLFYFHTHTGRVRLEWLGTLVHG